MYTIWIIYVSYQLSTVYRRGLPAHLVLSPSPTAAAIWAACMEVLTVHDQGTSEDTSTTVATTSTATIPTTTATESTQNNTSNDNLIGIIDPVLLEQLNNTNLSLIHI